MKIKLTLFLLLLRMLSFAQYDADKLTALYNYSDKSVLLLDQLLTQKAIAQYLTYNVKAQTRYKTNLLRMNTYLDSMVMNLPEEKYFKKKFLDIRSRWDIFKAFAEKNKASEDDWKELVKMHESLHSALNDLQARLMLLLTPEPNGQETLERLRSANRKVAHAFLSAVILKLFAKPPVNIDNQTDLIEKASKKIHKTENYFAKDDNARFLLTKIKSDLNTFHLGFKNRYDPQVMLATYEKFNDKIFRIHDLIFQKTEFY